MSDIIKEINKKNNVFKIGKISKDKIVSAENMLGLNFANEYKKYLCEFGVASYEEHELTGICDSKRLNVVDVTLEEKQYNNNVPDDFYVIEQAHIDGIVIWQSEKGEIFQTYPNGKPIKIFDSLAEYITQM